jgi:7-cyano-7-deazaguanine reductase
MDLRTNMEQVKNYSAVDEIAATHLGKAGGVGYKDQYDPGLLVQIPRYHNREAYGIEEADLPFIGVDVWNAYEVSALTDNGYPVSGMLKIICPADSKYHVESKSIKLYLNSFNMTKLGATREAVVKEIEQRVTNDLQDLLNTDIKVKLFRETDFERTPGKFTRYINVESMFDIDNTEFTSFKSDANQLDNQGAGEVRWYADFLRSNCRVTNQPDFGSVYIHLKGTQTPSAESIAKYIVSHRQVNHFHEEIAEMMYKHLLDRFNPEELMVACLYSRRGGLDINPIRANKADLIPDWFTDPTIRIEKELKQ